MPKPASKPIIAVDIDEVLASNAPGFVEFSNKQWGTNLKAEDYHEHWAELWQSDEEETEKRAIAYHGSGTIEKLKPLTEAKPVLERLSKKYRLIVITSRRALIEQATKVWIEKYYPGVFEEVYLAGIWDKVVKGRMDLTKAGLLKELGADYFIDDQPRHCFAAAEAGIKSLLFGNYKWNQNLEIPKGVTPTRNWQEVLEYFDAAA
jgi:uncharacterized HAD superfamily protein